jgi:extracellular matrix protein 14
VRKDFLDVRIGSDCNLEGYDNITQLIPSLNELFAISRMHHETSIKDFALSSMQNPDTGLHAIYHPYSAIESMLKLFASDYPDFARLEDIGRSAEGRSVYALTISDYREKKSVMTWRSRRRSSGKKQQEPVKEKKKLGFALIGGLHAREWIAPASLLYLAHSLLASASQPTSEEADDSLAIALYDYEFHFVPMVNPDGYVYSWEHDRLWQKSRQYTMSDEPRCRGIDLNRNWDYKYEKPQRPAPCSDLYPGADAFEAVELQVVSQYLQRVKESSGLHVFADVHSFGQMRRFRLLCY